MYSSRRPERMGVEWGMAGRDLVWVGVTGGG